MNPVSFGPDGQLYGVVSEASGSAERAVLICPPLGQEMIRSHRAVRRLAERLAENGADVLRFDYFGTGHSQGGDDDGTPQRWVNDVRSAADFLRSVSVAGTVTVVGLRMGALLALAAEVRAVRRMLLWDPIVEHAEVDLGAVRKPRSIVIVDSIADPATGHAVKLLGQGVEVVEAAGPSAWSEVGTTGAGAIPVTAIEELVERAR